MNLLLDQPMEHTIKKEFLLVFQTRRGSASRTHLNCTEGWRCQLPSQEYFIHCHCSASRSILFLSYFNIPLLVWFGSVRSPGILVQLSPATWKKENAITLLVNLAGTRNSKLKLRGFARIGRVALRCQCRMLLVTT